MIARAAVAVLALALSGCAGAAGLDPTAIAGGVNGVLSGVESVRQSVEKTEHSVREALARDRMGAAQYELCEGGSVGEVDRLLQKYPSLRAARKELCSKQGGEL